MLDYAHILVIDDEKNYLLVLETLLMDEGYTVTALSDPETALTFLEESEVDVVITDFKMPKLSGRDILNYLRKKNTHIPVIVMTAFGSIESAVDLMKEGAFDYITKPFANDELLISVHNACKLSQAHRQYKILQESIAEKYVDEEILGQSKVMREVRSLVEQSAKLKTPIMIKGERGTGKKHLAKVIHYSSDRKEMPLIMINCKSISNNSFLEEMFGIENEEGVGAFKRGKIEQSHKGTLFLEEIQELSQEAQDYLYELLNSKQLKRINSKNSTPIDIRPIVSSSIDIKTMVQDGLFREDLYYLLNIVEIKMPSLRERREDIPELVGYFTSKIAKENNISEKRFTAEALNYLTAYDWEGNIMQLQNVLERCIILVGGEQITDNDIPPEIRDEDGQFKSAVDLLPYELNLTDTLDKIEAALIRRALVRSDFVQAHAADTLGISRSLIQYKLKKYNITGH